MEHEIKYKKLTWFFSILLIISVGLCSRLQENKIIGNLGMFNLIGLGVLFTSLISIIILNLEE